MGSMKIKTSITLSEDLLKAMDQQSIQYKNRSEFIETALWTFINQMIRNAQNAKGLEIISRRADRLNKEA